MATASSLINEAIQRSDLNNPDLVPTAQMLSYLNNYQRAVYLRAARLNPEYFGTSGATAARGSATGSWNLAISPGDVAAVTMLEVATLQGTPTLAAGDRIYLISKRWPEMGVPPRAYIRGQVLSGYNGELADDGSNYVDTVTVYYSPLPASVTSISSNLSLPDEWNDLITLRLASVLSTRDGRLQESQALMAEYAMALAIFDEAVQVYDHGALRPLNAVPAYPVTPPSQPGA